MENVEYLGLPNCLRLTNGRVELIATTDVGPRVVRYGFAGGENVLGECPRDSVLTELGEFKPWGGHRLWAAPEDKPKSYAPDNAPVKYHSEAERSVRLVPPLEEATGLQKELTVTLDKVGSSVRVQHRITNHNEREIELALWALTIMRGGGVAILPQEPFRAHSEYLLPARPLVLWHYTDLSDPRWTLGAKFIRLRTDDERKDPQKIGIANKQGWAAYHVAQTLFVKHFAYEEGATYPDYGSNNEIFTAASFIEVESLAPLRRLRQGESAEHVEHWSLFDSVRLAEDDDGAEAALRGCLKSPLYPVSADLRASRLSISRVIVA